MFATRARQLPRLGSRRNENLECKLWWMECVLAKRWIALWMFGVVPFALVLGGPSPLAAFTRGDANNDQFVSLTDVAAIYAFLLSSAPLSPDGLLGADVNDNGVIELSDPLYLVEYLFASGPPPPAPFPVPGGVSAPPFSATPDGSVVATVSAAQAEPGTLGEVSVTLTHSVDVAGVLIHLQFDPTRVVHAELELSNTFVPPPGWSTITEVNELEGLALLAAFRTFPPLTVPFDNLPAGTVELAKLRLMPRYDAPAGEMISISLASPNVQDPLLYSVASHLGQPRAVQLNAGSVEVLAAAASDCNSNTTPDLDELAMGSSLDCNLNGQPDECDITAGLETDCNVDGAADSCAWNQVQVWSSPQADDEFHHAIATLSDQVFFGAPNQSSGAGSVLVFDDLQGPDLTVANLESGDAFGASLAASADLLIVGAPGDDDGAPDQGAVYVFREVGSNLVLEQKLLASSSDTVEGFGTSLAVLNDRIAIGAPGSDTSSGIDAGACFLFEFDSVTDTWNQVSQLGASDSAAGDRMGATVSLTPTHLIGGSPEKTENSEANAGAVYAFLLDGPGPAEQKITASLPTAQAQFGATLAATDDRLVVAAPAPGQAVGGEASTYSLDETTGLWSFESVITPATPNADDRFGAALSIRGTELLVGIPGAGAAEGAAERWQFRSWSGWRRVQSLLPHASTPNAQYGLAVLRSDNEAIISALDGTGSQAYRYRDGVEDCNGNLVPDSCELFDTLAGLELGNDCNGNTRLDECDLASGMSADCNNNAIPDECDISSGNSDDINLNGVPDECEAVTPVQNLMCTPSACEIELTWAPGQTYDEIRVLRAGVVVALLAGDATIFEDFSPGIAPQTYEVVGASFGFDSPAATCTTSVLVQTLEAGSTSVAVGGQGSVVVQLQTTGQIRGLSYGICHDSALVTALTLSEGADVQALNGGLGPEFGVLNVLSDGVTQALVPAFMQIVTLPAGTNELAIATYEGVGAPGNTANLDFCNTLTDGVTPPVAVSFTCSGGATFGPATSSGSVEILDGVVFIRGDCNVDGSFNVADAVNLLGLLFGGGNTTTCEDACDGNDDGSRDIGDAVYMLGNLFSMGDPPPAPHPGCGVDPTMDLLGCVAGPAACP